MSDERDERSIDEMEQDVVNVSSGPPVDEEDEWAGETRKEDEFSDRDGEAKLRVYTLSIPNKAIQDGKPNPGYRKLCLDKDFTIPPREIIRCAVIDRVMPKIAQVPYKEAQKLPQDEPWKRYLGYSRDGIAPSHDSDGNYWKLCMNGDRAFKKCSQPTVFKDGSPIEVPLDDGECPWGRWGNNMVDADRQTYKISDDASPTCNDEIILFCWDWDRSLLFKSYWKVMSLGFAKDFLASCTVGLGDKQTKYPFYAFEAQISILDKEEYVIPKIVNTLKKHQLKKIKPIVAWFEQNRSSIVKNLIVEMHDLKKKKEQEGEFDKSKYE